MMEDGSRSFLAHQELRPAEVPNRRQTNVRTSSLRTSRSQGKTKTANHSSPSIRVLQLNIEGISRDKCDVLSKVARQNNADVIALQELHVTSNEQLDTRGKIEGYSLVDFLPSSIHGLATYVRDGLNNCSTLFKRVELGVSLLAIKVANIHIINIYKPPTVFWPESLSSNTHFPTVYVGDFNCHHTTWGYSEDDRSGISLVNWIDVNNLYLVFDAKDRPSFYSARWKKGYNPDLCLVTTNVDGMPFPISRKVLEVFPHSQHRPILHDIGINITKSFSLPKSRWNFCKADWKGFAQATDSTLRWIRPNINNYVRFVGVIKGAAKKTIPRGYRKEYIPSWSSETQQLYVEYQKNPNSVNADKLLTSMNYSRKERWNNLMQQMNFTHSSRSAWNLLKKLGTSACGSHQEPQVSANSIASRLISVSNSVKIDGCAIKKMKRKIKQKRRTTPETSDLSDEFVLEELEAALYLTKSRKAAGFDEIYPEFLKNLGPLGKRWLLALFNSILFSGKLPREFKKAKVVAVLKPGKPATDPSSFRPISLLSVTYKVLERMIYQRISPIIEELLPQEQAGFRSGRNCCDQVLALTSFIEAGFQKGLKSGAIFVDLTAAYDTVWRDGLLFKLYSAIPCKRIINLIDNMLTNRQFKVFLGEQSSRVRTLHNGLPQGSVLSPLLFNLYTSDIPETSSSKFVYADDIALIYQHNDFRMLESCLTDDLSTMSEYFKQWRLCPSPLKTEVCCFHLANQFKYKELSVRFDGVIVKTNFYPKYLGVTLDRSLTYKCHLEKLRQKLKTRVNILHKLAGTTWGTTASTLRTTALALVFSPAEYCSPVWSRSVHITKIDSQLHTAMRIISGTIKSTPIPWLSILANIAPPSLRREFALKREWAKIELNADSLPIWRTLNSLPPKRLKSRSPVWNEPYLKERTSIEDKWRDACRMQEFFNKELIADPTKRVPGFDEPRGIWCKLNRLRTGQGRCNSLLFKYGAVPSEACECGEVETIKHIVVDCPLKRLEGGFKSIHEVSPVCLNWLSSLKPL